MPHNSCFTLVFSAEATVQHLDRSVEDLLGWDLDVAASSGLGLFHPSDRLAIGSMLKFVRSQPEADASLEVRLVSGDLESSDSHRSWVPATLSAVNALDDDELPGLRVTVALSEAEISRPEMVESDEVSPEDRDVDEVAGHEREEEHDGGVSPEDLVTNAGGSVAGVASFGPFDQDRSEEMVADRSVVSGTTLADDPSQATDIGILLRPGSSVIDVVTGPVQGKLGCHPDSLAGLHLWELLHRDDEAEFTEALDAMEARPDGEVHPYGPLRFLTASGSERTFSTTVIRKPNGLIVRARDTGADEQLGDALHTETAVVFLDQSFNVTYASASFAELLGRPATTAVGMEILAAVHPSDRSYVEQRLREPGLDGEIHGFLRIPHEADADAEESASADVAWRWIEVIGRNYLDDPTVAQIALQLTVVDDQTTTDDNVLLTPERLGTFTRDQDGNVSFINDVLLTMLGNVDAVDFATERSRLVDVGDNGISETIEIDSGDDSVRYLRSRLSPIIGADGERTGDVAVVEDITRLVESGDLPDSEIDGTEGSVLVVERGVGIKYLSADLADLTGADLTTELHDIFTPKSAVMIRSDVWPAVLADGVWSGQLWLRSDAGAVPFHAQFYNEADLDAGEPLASVILTPLESVPEWEHEDQLAVDPLTLLASGAGLKRQAVRAIAKTVGNRSKVVVALIEIDCVEDLVPSADGAFELSAAGHDALSVAIADRLALACRHDESAARIDQRTFAVLSQRLGDAIDLEHLTARIIDELSPTFVTEIDETERYLTVQFNLGLAHTGEQSEGSARSMSADELFANADLALQRARSRGRIRTAIVGENGQLEIAERRSLDDDFRVALSGDQLSSQIDNVYQAILPSGQAKALASGTEYTDSTDGGEPLRFEALVRWHCPSRGLVGATEVVELADKLSMTSAVGHRVIDRSLDFIASTKRLHDLSIEVDVNVSPDQAIERGFASRLDAMLRLYEVEPEQLGIEFTESTIMSASPALTAALDQLLDLGVRLVADDVTGRLFRSPIDSVGGLKINRRLVEGVGRHAADTAQVAGILARSAERELEVTAVGVATGRQLELLTDLGCSRFQGFLLGRPNAANEHDFSGMLSEMKDPITDAIASDEPGVA